jgi:hypothetical protein
MYPYQIYLLPQVAEMNTPRPVDAVGECSLYDDLKRDCDKSN